MTTLMRWDPMRDLWGVQRDLDRLMSAFSTSSSPSTTTLERAGTVVPSIDVIRRGEDLVVRAEMPGIKPEDIDISVADGVLVLTGDRHAESEKTEDDYVVRETSHSTFERSMRLPKELDPSTLRAEYRDGVLEVLVPGGSTTLEQPKAIHIPVSTPEPAKLESTH